MYFEKNSSSKNILLIFIDEKCFCFEILRLDGSTIKVHDKFGVCGIPIHNLLYFFFFSF